MTHVDDSLLTKFGLARPNGEDGTLEAIDLRPADYKAYGIDSQVRPSNAMIDLWLLNGNERAFAYTHLYQADFDPSSGVTIQFSEHHVTIVGRHLHELYRALKRHRVVFIWEADAPTSRLVSGELPVVTSITIRTNREVYEASE